MAIRSVSWVLAAGFLLALAGCEEGAGPFGGLRAAGGDETAPATTRLVERDVEAPQVFQVSETGLWDGRPSLGGVWVAYPGVSDPERVIIRNPANGKFVIGALFRRERENPGPKLQVSSDAAATLGMLAGQPAQLSVTALRREEVAEDGPPAQPILDSAETVSTETLAPAPATATIAPEAPVAEAAKPATRPAARPADRPKDARPAPAATGGRDLLQIGIFSVEANANRAAGQVKKAGAEAQVRKEESQGKAFWRVLAGPAASAADREALLAKVKQLGYADAYFVSR